MCIYNQKKAATVSLREPPFVMNPIILFAPLNYV